MYGKEYLEWKNFKKQESDAIPKWYMGHPWYDDSDMGGYKGTSVSATDNRYSSFVYQTSVTSGPYSDRFMHSPIPDRY